MNIAARRSASRRRRRTVAPRMPGGISHRSGARLNRVFGSEHEITYRLMERKGFSEDEVKAILEPEGLWNKVLKFDESRLKQLLADKTTAEDIRKQLESLKHITSSYPKLWLKKRAGEEE